GRARVLHCAGRDDKKMPQPNMVHTLDNGYSKFTFSKRQCANAYLSCLGFLASVSASWNSPRFTGVFLPSGLSICSLILSFLASDVMVLLLVGRSRTAAAGEAVVSVDGKASNVGPVLFKTASKVKFGYPG
ncbi:hypothetical protein Tco_1453145, partial [Tanacetum coccineum]